MDINELLDECKKALQVDTDYQLHKKTGMSEADLSYYRRGLKNPNNKTIFIIADILKIDEKCLIADFEQQNAKSEKTKEFWKKKLVELGGIAASFIFAITFIMTPTPAKAAPVLKFSVASVYYVK